MNTTAADKTILVVDDDELIRGMLRDFLEDSGFCVITEPDGFSACRHALNNPSNIDLLVCDILMPKINGIETYLALRRLKPDLIAIFISGYPNGHEMARKNSIEVDFFPKPLNLGQFITRIKELLGVSGTDSDRRGVTIPDREAAMT